MSNISRLCATALVLVMALTINFVQTRTQSVKAAALDDSAGLMPRTESGFAPASATGIADANEPLLKAVSMATVLEAGIQGEWRSCGKCKTLFFNGYPNKGRCPAGRRHEATLGANFMLRHDDPADHAGQHDWRFCAKCEALFFDGYPQKGVCPAGGGHAAAGYNFSLLHDRPAQGYNENNWRYCNNCHVLFFNGDSDKGVCSAGGGHVAAGYNFVLKFRGNLEGDVQQNPANN